MSAVRTSTTFRFTLLCYIAERFSVSETSQEAFVLRLFREATSNGFVKGKALAQAFAHCSTRVLVCSLLTGPGFSEYAEMFIRGYARIEKVMRNLFVKRLYLWPRSTHANSTQAASTHTRTASTHKQQSHANNNRTVSTQQAHANSIASLTRRFHTSINEAIVNIEFQEVMIDMTPRTIEIQTQLMNVMRACIDEIQSHPELATTTELTTENCLLSSFDSTIQRILGPIWNKLNPKTKQLIEDIRQIRKLLVHLIALDAVGFARMLDSLKTDGSLWMFFPNADKVFELAQNRIRSNHSVKIQRKTEEHDQAQTNEQSNAVNRVNIEIPPKWNALLEILDEIRLEYARSDVAGGILILVKDAATVWQLREFLEHGEAMLASRHHDFVRSRGAQQFARFKPKTKPKSKARPKAAKTPNAKKPSAKANAKVEAKKKTKSVEVGAPSISRFFANPPKQETHEPEATPALAQGIQEHVPEFDLVAQTDTPDVLVYFDESFELITAPHITIHPTGRRGILDDIRPAFLILYEPDLATVREAEVSIALCALRIVHSVRFVFTWKVVQGRESRLAFAGVFHVLREFDRGTALEHNLAVRNERVHQTHRDAKQSRDRCEPTHLPTAACRRASKASTIQTRSGQQARAGRHAGISRCVAVCAAHARLRARSDHTRSWRLHSHSGHLH
jgi:DNA excision repair protein ERCC-4